MVVLPFLMTDAVRAQPPTVFDARASLFYRRRVFAFASGDALARIATTGIAGCCARAASGHAAAPPSVAKNFRRAMWLAM
jgi:hypothetical protein